VSKLGGETPSRIRAWSLIRNEKPIVLFERHCHATEKSEAIDCARSCQSSWLTRWWTQKEKEKNGGPRTGLRINAILTQILPIFCSGFRKCFRTPIRSRGFQRISGLASSRGPRTHQGCQIIIDTLYRNGENIPNCH
jgi:hypothetical protein